jgi:hypothetical protein
MLWVVSMGLIGLGQVYTESRKKKIEPLLFKEIELRILFYLTSAYYFLFKELHQFFL